MSSPLRSLGVFVHALAGRRIPVRSAPPGTARAFANEFGFFLPDSFAMYQGALERQAKVAAAAHLAAHARFGGPRWPRAQLRPIQIVLVSLFEDARVERAALGELPGLRRLWAPFYEAQPSDHATFPALCARIARALFDRDYADAHPLVQKARDFFYGAGDTLSPHDVRRFGSLLGNDVGQLRLSFNAREYAVQPPYRDDHQLLWEENESTAANTPPVETEIEIEDLLERVAPEPAPTAERTSTRREAQPEPQADSGSDVPRARFEAVPVTEASPARYPEWDYRIGESRPGFCTVIERRASITKPAGSLALGQTTPRPTRRRWRIERLAQERGCLEGDALDLDRAVQAAVDRRTRAAPDARVYIRTKRQPRRFAILTLLDQSRSTEARVPGSSASVLELAAAACIELGHLLSESERSFAVHGFSSNGRSEVDYRRYKDFDEPWSEAARARIAAVEPLLSTRMGAALRHAGQSLRPLPTDQRRLVLLLTDGEPSDVDSPDPKYLLEDARHAVSHLRAQGVDVFAVGLDPSAAAPLARICGNNRYAILNRLERLPELLPRLAARLAR